MSGIEANIDGLDHSYEGLNALLGESDGITISVENARAYIHRSASSILVEIYSTGEFFTHFTVEKGSIPTQGERKLYSWEGGTSKPGTMWYKKPRDTFATWLTRFQEGIKEAWTPPEREEDENKWEYHS